MPIKYTDAFKSTISRLSAPEVPLIALQIDHRDLDEPIRVINDRQDLTIQGKRFVACGFTVTLPADQERTIPKAQLEIDNVGRDLMYWIETSHGGKGATAKFMRVMRSAPDVIEWQTTMDAKNLTCTFQRVSCNLAYVNINQRPAIALAYRPDTAPGVF